MADIKTLGTIKAETGRNLDDLTEDADNVFVETAAGVAGVSSIFKMISRRIHNVLSGLSALASGADTDYAVVVRNGTAEKITLNKLADYVMASGQDASVDSLTVTGSASFGGTINVSEFSVVKQDDANMCIPSRDGIQFFKSDKGINCPPEGDGIIIAKRQNYSNHYVQQTYYNDNSLAIYVRYGILRITSSTWEWTDWKRLITEDNASIIVKKIKYEGRISQNGNINLDNYVNSKMIVIGVTAQLKDNPSALVSCIPYQYHSNTPEYFAGVHCVSENASVVITNQNCNGYIFYI